MGTRGTGWVFLLAALASAAVLGACEGAQAPPTVTPSPTATPVSTPSPGATASPTPSPTGEPAAYHLVYRQFGPLSDTIWRLDPANPDEPQQIATLGHREGWGVFASVSPQRDAIAYTVLPEGARDPDGEAQAYVLPLSGSSQLVAQRIDLRSTPVWSPDGRFLYLRRSSGTTITILEVDINNREERELVSANSGDVAGLFPIGLSSDGQRLYYAQIASDGSTTFAAYDLVRDQASTLVLASPQIAGEYDLSPDSSRIAFTTAGRTFIADLGEGTVTPIESDLLLGTVQYQPKWRADGLLALGQFPSAEEPSPALVIDPATGQGSSLAPPDSGFDEPLGWSPDGQLLAVALRSTDGQSRALVLIGSQGQRLLVTDDPNFLFVGWI